VSNREDVDLAKRLLQTGLLPEASLREAFALQARVRQEREQHVPLPRVLYHLGLLPKGSLDAALGPSPLTSQPFPGYRLTGVLGEGGTSIVYRGTYLENGAAVAVKVLDPLQALKPGWVERFRLEGRILIDVDHENVILGYEVGEAAGLYFFSMECIEGITVEEVLERRGRLGNEEAMSIVLQMARALGALHAAGYLHRDVKPSNVLVTPDGRAVMIDLGFTQALEEAEGAAADTPTRALTVGTVEYLSPEQARGRVDLDPRSDIYSLGVSLYHMVVGEVPFQATSDQEVIAMQVLAGIDAQKLKQRHIAPEVQFFITKMMSKDRNHRFETMADVVRELAGYVPARPIPIDLGVPPEGAAPPVLTPLQPPRAGAAPGKAPAPTPPRSTGQAPVPRRRRDKGDPPRRGRG
jgi:serine/threonine-protein kinase